MWCLTSESVRIISNHPITVNALIVANNDDHLVQLGLNFNAAWKTGEHWVTMFSCVKSSLFVWVFRVQCIEPGVTNMDGALSARDSSTIVIVGYLMWLHRVFFITALAVAMNTRSPVSFENLHEWFSSVACIASRNTIRRNAVNPDNLIGDFDSSALDSWSQSVATATKHAWDLTWYSLNC